MSAFRVDGSCGDDQKTADRPDICSGQNFRYGITPATELSGSHPLPHTRHTPFWVEGGPWSRLRAPRSDRLERSGALGFDVNGGTERESGRCARPARWQEPLEAKAGSGTTKRETRRSAAETGCERFRRIQVEIAALLSRTL
jgi:hypothetical protein